MAGSVHAENRSRARSTKEEQSGSSQRHYGAERFVVRASPHVVTGLDSLRELLLKLPSLPPRLLKLRRKLLPRRRRLLSVRGRGVRSGPGSLDLLLGSLAVCCRLPQLGFLLPRELRELLDLLRHAPLDGLQLPDVAAEILCRHLQEEQRQRKAGTQHKALKTFPGGPSSPSLLTENQQPLKHSLFPLTSASFSSAIAVKLAPLALLAALLAAAASPSAEEGAGSSSSASKAGGIARLRPRRSRSSPASRFSTLASSSGIQGLCFS